MGRVPYASAARVSENELGGREVSAVRITMDQVLAWRLSRQYAEPRADVDTVTIITRLCGVQAQVASAASLAVRLRRTKSDAHRDGIDAALAAGELVKTWAMRGTLHLLSPAEGPAFLPLLASTRTWEKPAWQRTFGATPKDIAALGERVSTVLDNTTLSRAELIDAIVADKKLAGMKEHLTSGWGTLLKPLAWQGLLCHGPNRGRNVTFTRPDALVPNWTVPPDPDEAAPIAIAAYLGAYGPSTPEVFDDWLSRSYVKKATLRGWFEDMGDRLATIDVEGRPAYVLAEHLDDLMRTKPTKSVRLFGAFDQYILGPTTKAVEQLPAEHRSKVSKTAGWIAPIVVVGGQIAGTWEQADGVVTVSLFPGVAKPSPKAVEAEVAHVARATGHARLAVQVA